MCGSSWLWRISLVLVAMLPGSSRAEWPCDGDTSWWSKDVPPALRTADIDEIDVARLTGDELEYVIAVRISRPVRTDTIGQRIDYSPEKGRALLEAGLADGRLEPSARVLSMLAEAEQNTGDVQRGRETLRRAAELTHCDHLWLRLVLKYAEGPYGRRMDLRGDRRKAAEILSEALDRKLIAADQRHYEYLVRLWSEARDHLRAVEIFERHQLPVQNGSRGKATTYMYLDAAFEACQQQRFDLAQSLIQKAIAIDPKVEGSERAISVQAILYESTGRTELARRLRATLKPPSPRPPAPESDSTR
jgi:tetratricopeptide (TPR) repeat protein